MLANITKLKQNRWKLAERPRRGKDQRWSKDNLRALVRLVKAGGLHAVHKIRVTSK